MSEHESIEPRPSRRRSRRRSLDPVEAFRRSSNPRRTDQSEEKLSTFEKITLGAAAPAVMVGPFLFGGMNWWAQCIINGMQAFLFLVVMLPLTGVAEWKSRMIKLIKLPPFWLGGLFVLYVTIQALNPSWLQIYVTETSWYIAQYQPEHYISWLPQSIESNFYTMNAWRMVIYWGGAWLFVCGLWAGLNSRRAWLALGWMALGTAAILSLASIAHHLSSNEHLFWFSQFERPKASFGPFVYRNHAGAYLYLAMGLGLALTLHLLRTGGGRSGLPWVAFFAAFVCGLGVAINPSRGGWIGGAGVLIVFLGLLPFAIQWRRGISTAAIVGGGMVFSAIAATTVWFLSQSDFSKIMEKWKNLENDGETSLQTRLIASQITFDMFEDRMIFGWGPGSFYYSFPRYLLVEPDLYFAGKPGYRNYGKRTHRFKQAHNDHIQFLAEYGVAGYSLLGATTLWWLGSPIWIRVLSPDSVVGIGIGLVFMIHNLGDFLMQNPITLQGWVFILLIPVALIRIRQFK